MPRSQIVFFAGIAIIVAIGIRWNIAMIVRAIRTKREREARTRKWVDEALDDAALSSELDTLLDDVHLELFGERRR